jgi:octanoyl-[GcvH]:protein N-octanoyltransferase
VTGVIGAGSASPAQVVERQPPGPWHGGPFGVGPVWLAEGSGLSSPQEDMDLSLAALAGLGQVAEGRLRVHRPRPTAAFSRLDSLAPGFGDASSTAAEHGFAPVVRPAGGRLAAYHDGALVLDLVAPHPDARAGHRARFAIAAEALVDGLRELGVDARVGPVPGEYCPGDYSVNARGVTKLVGTAQRITRHGFLFSAVVLVADPEPIRAVLVDTYRLLGLTWDPATVGSVSDDVPGVTAEDVAAVLVPRVLGSVDQTIRPNRHR